MRCGVQNVKIAAYHVILKVTFLLDDKGHALTERTTDSAAGCLQ